MSTTVMEKQVEIARIALTTNDEEFVTKLLNYARKLIKKEEKKTPCQYTIDEVKTGIKQSVEDVENDRTMLYDVAVKRYSI